MANVKKTFFLALVTNLIFSLPHKNEKYRLLSHFNQTNTNPKFGHHTLTCPSVRNHSVTHLTPSLRLL